MSYRLNDYVDFKKIIINNDYAKEKHLIIKNYGNLYLIKYDKSFLNINNYESLGLFRSVIVNKEGKLVSYSPPKSYNLNLDTCSTKNVFKFEDYELQPFIEGTMINLFWHPYLNDWEITTRSFISAKNKFSTPNTFRYMFLQCCNDTNLNFDDLDKKYCYSFVMQHIENRIVVPIISNALFLVNVYEFTDGTVYCKNLKEFNDKFINSTVSILTPDLTLSNINSFNGLISLVNETDLDYKILGYICYNKNDGSRIKIRNPNYETVRHLKGNTPKIQFQYYYLRKNNKVKEFLKFYPEHSKEFSKLRHDLHNWTNHLYQHYVKCFIVKEKKLINAPYEYKPHLYQLHKEYINELMEQKKYVTKSYVINYVNNLPPQRLMYAVNHKLKQQQVDNKIAEVLNK
jgi:hypothetical protein